MLFGLNGYDGAPSAMRRQGRAAAALSTLPGIEAVNLQFAGSDALSLGPLRCVPVLRHDSRSVTRAGGRRKPIVREMFDVLALLAAEQGHTHFAYLNSDIVVTPAALELLARHDRQTYVFSRGDCDDLGDETTCADPSPGAATMMTAGQDMFVVSVAWWARHAWRFRPYIAGEGCWDNVYTAVMMCHSDGLILNRHPYVLHEQHPAAWQDDSPAARYNGMLAAQDARYFSLWCEYWGRLESGRRHGATHEDEARLRDTQFVWRRSARAAALQLLRTARARRQFRRLQHAWRRPTTADSWQPTTGS